MLFPVWFVCVVCAVCILWVVCIVGMLDAAEVVARLLVVERSSFGRRSLWNRVVIVFLFRDIWFTVSFFLVLVLKLRKRFDFRLLLLKLLVFVCFLVEFFRGNFLNWVALFRFFNWFFRGFDFFCAVVVVFFFVRSFGSSFLWRWWPRSVLVRAVWRSSSPGWSLQWWGLRLHHLDPSIAWHFDHLSSRRMSHYVVLSRDVELSCRPAAFCPQQFCGGFLQF